MSVNTAALLIMSLGIAGWVFHIQLKKHEPVIDALGLAIAFGCAMAVFCAIMAWYEARVYQLPWKLGDYEDMVFSLIAAPIALGAGTIVSIGWDRATQALGLSVAKPEPEPDEQAKPPTE